MCNIRRHSTVLMVAIKRSIIGNKLFDDGIDLIAMGDRGHMTSAIDKFFPGVGKFRFQYL